MYSDDKNNRVTEQSNNLRRQMPSRRSSRSEGHSRRPVSADSAERGHAAVENLFAKERIEESAPSFLREPINERKKTAVRRPVHEDQPVSVSAQTHRAETQTEKPAVTIAQEFSAAEASAESVEAKAAEAAVVTAEVKAEATAAETAEVKAAEPAEVKAVVTAAETAEATAAEAAAVTEEAKTEEPTVETAEVKTEEPTAETAEAKAEPTVAETSEVKAEESASETAEVKAEEPAAEMAEAKAAETAEEKAAETAAETAEAKAEEPSAEKTDEASAESGQTKETPVKKKKTGLIILICVILVLLIAAAVIVFKVVLPNTNQKTESPNYMEQIRNQLVKENDVEAVDTFFENYYAALASGNTTAIESMFDDPSKVHITTEISNIVNQYDNLKVYVTNGINENDIVAFVYNDIHFENIDATAPSVDSFYLVYDEDEAALKICADMYTDPEILKFMNLVSYRDPIRSLLADTNKDLNKILAGNKDLNNLYILMQSIASGITEQTEPESTVTEK